MERSSTGDEYDDVPRDIGKRMHSVGEREAHSNSKVIYSNLEPKQNNSTCKFLVSLLLLYSFNLSLSTGSSHVQVLNGQISVCFESTEQVVLEGPVSLPFSAHLEASANS